MITQREQLKRSRRAKNAELEPREPVMAKLHMSLEPYVYAHSTVARKELNEDADGSEV